MVGREEGDPALSGSSASLGSSRLLRDYSPEHFFCVGSWGDGPVVKSPVCSSEDPSSLPSTHVSAHHCL